jgi:CDP-diacylglycerol--glycerol-3-phosphate 3-phosphatidyltransferase
VAGAPGMLASNLRAPINKVAQPLGRAVARTGVSANALTLAGVLLVALGTAVFCSGRLVVGAIVVGVGGILDLFDGAVAKATHTASHFGAFLDSTTDRLSDGILFSGVAWFLVRHPTSGVRLGLGVPAVLALALAVLVLGFLTSYIKGRAEAAGYTCDLGIAERGERVFIMAVSIFFNLMVPALVVLFLLSSVTVIQRFVHVAQQAKAS